MPRRSRHEIFSGMDSPEPPSRSRRKRDSTALQKMGEALTRLGAAELERMPLTVDLREAVREWARIASREGRRRQMQYIGRLMREQADAAVIAEALSARKDAHSAQTRTFRRVEDLRAELLAADDPAKLCASFGERAAEVCELVSRARGERENGRDPHAYRALFRVLQECAPGRGSETGTPPLPPPAAS